MNALFPIASLVPCTLAQANDLLTCWSHKMGPVNRPNGLVHCHALLHEDEPVALTVTSSLIRENVAGRPDLNRETCVELSRLCAGRPGMNRVMLRLWRELVFPTLGYAFAISYQDADLHSGNTYRFDGWTRIGYSHSGVDPRSGRVGRNKWIWMWAVAPAADNSKE